MNHISARLLSGTGKLVVGNLLIMSSRGKPIFNMEQKSCNKIR
jgi:hypothetical protein